jgi:hypothetical protein
MSDWAPPSTSNRPPPPPPPPAAPAADAERAIPPWVLPVIVGALVAVAAMLPWITVRTVFGSVSRSGVDQGGDGIFTAALGIAGAVAAYKGSRKRLAGAAACGGIAAAVSLYHLLRVSDRAASISSDYAVAEAGFGLWLSLGASVVLCGSAVTQMSHGTSMPTDDTLPWWRRRIAGARVWLWLLILAIFVLMGVSAAVAG